MLERRREETGSTEYGEREYGALTKKIKQRNSQADRALAWTE
jgi:hypothetical protein